MSVPLEKNSLELRYVGVPVDHTFTFWSARPVRGILTVQPSILLSVIVFVAIAYDQLDT